MSSTEQIHEALTRVIEWERRRSTLVAERGQLETDLHIAEREIHRWNTRYRALIAKEMERNE